MKLKRIVPPEFIRALIFFMASGMFFLGLTKIIFYVANRNSFQNLRMLDILASFWVDAITVALTFIPFTILWLIPYPFRTKSIYKNVFRLLFLVNIAFLSAANLMDVVYYNFSGKRSTFDLFAVVGHEEGMGNQWISYVKDFGWLAVLLILFLILANFIFNRIYRWFIPEKSTVRPIRYVYTVVLTITLLILVSRGGLGLRPFGLISISMISSPENVGFVSNTAFTMLKTFDDPGLERVHFMDPNNLDQFFNPIHQYSSRPFENLTEKPNVVVIILESFGNEWLGSSRENESYTPFLDSLCTEGYFFPNSYANGTKSIEAMPAVLASMPSFMETPYITSRYASNKLNGVGFMLKEFGYSSAFFHSAAKGTMNFDGFAALIGLEQYFGKEDYPDQKDFDGTWGIFDHKFLPWTVKKMSEMKQPFFNSIFTVSSHHPYTIPKEFEGKLKTGPYPLCQSLNYADHTLRAFFDAAKKEAWYDNTLFVLVADHTSSSKSTYYGQTVGKFSIPILYFMPKGQIPIKTTNQISQQIDILPSVLHYIGYEKPFYAVGQSIFQNKYKPFSVNYIQGVYTLAFDNYLLILSGLQEFQLFDIQRDPGLSKNIFEEKKHKIESECLFLQALIQRCVDDLLDNTNHAPQN